jgi:hypothetical protein
MRYYKARWGALLVIMSTLLTVLLVGLAISEFRQHGASAWAGRYLLALVVGCALFSVRGYTVTPEAILIQRLLWHTRLPLTGLQSARRETQSMWRGIRIGNGGFFSFTGWRWSPGLGFYRVFATNGADRVVLRYANRIVVVTPSPPDDFVRELEPERRSRKNC